MTPDATDLHARAAAALAGHDDYRVLRRLQPVRWFHLAETRVHEALAAARKPARVA